MKRKARKILTLLTAMAMVFSTLGLSAYAEETDAPLSQTFTEVTDTIKTTTVNEGDKTVDTKETEETTETKVEGTKKEETKKETPTVNEDEKVTEKTIVNNDSNNNVFVKGGSENSENKSDGKSNSKSGIKSDSAKPTDTPVIEDAFDDTLNDLSIPKMAAAVLAAALRAPVAAPKAGDNEITVTYIANGGTPGKKWKDTETHTKGQAFEITVHTTADYIMPPSGKVFDKCLVQIGDNTPFPTGGDGYDISINADNANYDIKVTYQWKDATGATPRKISFVNNTTSNNRPTGHTTKLPSDTSAPQGTGFTIPTNDTLKPVVIGNNIYTWEWTSVIGSLNTQYPLENNAFVVPSSNVTVYGKWTKATKRTVELNAYPSDGGTVEGAGDYANGSSVTIKATPNAGFEFLRWERSSGQTPFSEEAEYTFEITQNISLNARFSPITYEIKLGVSPDESGTVTGSGTYGHNKEVTVKATPNTGYEFVEWKEGETQVSTDAEYKFNAEANRNLTAVFEKVYTVTVTGGTASPTEGVSGTEVTLTPDSKDGYEFKGWKVKDDAVTIGENNKFKIGTADVEIEAEFEKVYTVSVTGGTASPTEGISGTEVTLTPDSKDGFVFKGWNVKSGDVTIDEDNKFKIGTANVDIEAEFEESKYYFLDEAGNEVTDFSWEQGSGKDLVITVKCTVSDELTFGKFRFFKMNGEDVDESLYKKKSGSLILTISSAYLESLSAGNYDISIGLEDTELATSLSIEEASNNNENGNNENGNNENGNNESGNNGSENKDDNNNGKSENGGTFKEVEKKEEAAKGDSPKTGDVNSIVLWSVLLMSAVMVSFVVTRKKARTQK